jgi:cytochrome c biogenesis protein CcmG, thiol:disulfide interchange protein DsbE
MKRMPRSARPFRTVLSLAFALTLVLFGCRDGQSEAVAGPSGPAPRTDFRLETLEGRPLGPRDFRGQVVVVDFWATWCGPCHIQTKILEPIHKDFKGKGVQFLAANVGEDTDTVRAFLAKRPIPYTVLMDPEDVAGELGVMALPTLLIIDKKGRVSYFEPGLADGPTIRQALRQAGA